jgi:PKD repeat protein
MVKQGHGEAIVSVSSTAGLTGLRDKQTRRNRAHQKRGHRLRYGAVTYDWSLSSVPKDSAARLANQTSDRPTFTPDKVGTYVVSLVVTDSSGAKSTPDATNVTVTPTQPSNTTLTAQASKTDLYLGDQASISGRLVDADGNGIPNQTISFKTQARVLVFTTDYPVKDTKTDSTGVHAV